MLFRSQYQNANINNQYSNINSPQSSFFYNYQYHNPHQNQPFQQPFYDFSGNKELFYNQNNREFSNKISNTNYENIYNNFSQGGVFPQNMQTFNGERYTHQIGQGMIGVYDEKITLPNQLLNGLNQLSGFSSLEPHKSPYNSKSEEKKAYLNLPPSNQVTTKENIRNSKVHIASNNINGLEYTITAEFLVEGQKYNKIGRAHV